MNPQCYYTLAGYDLKNNLLAILIGINIAQAIKTIHINVVFTREYATHAGDTHWYIVSMQNSTPSTRLTSQHTVKLPQAARNY